MVRIGPVRARAKAIRKRASMVLLRLMSSGSPSSSGDRVVDLEAASKAEAAHHRERLRTGESVDDNAPDVTAARRDQVELPLSALPRSEVLARVEVERLGAGARSRVPISSTGLPRPRSL
jgi:hypothetical protein